MKNLCLVVSVLLFGLPSLAQKKNETFRLNIRKATSPIVIDGVGNDLAWKDTDVAKDFFMVLPMDEGPANELTEIRMAYDDKNIYLLATFFNTTPGPNFVESLRRDFSFGKNDNFLLFMDPFNNQTTGFSFGSNASGAQWDGTMYEGGKVDLNWDSKWTSKVMQYDDKWVFEMSVPFKSIRYREGVKEWGINFSRLDLGASEKSSWTPVPRQFPTASLAYTGVLVWDNPPPTPGSNISLIPYVLGGFNEDTTGENTFDKKIGGDVKVSLSSSLNLDVTINPDFSQVEVDRQITNLDRFELFFPEKRQFFLENGDLFANFGYPTIRPFFSRRIGLDAPIRAGARVSGNINDKWRLGVMDMQTGRVEDMGLPNQNFGVISLQRKVFSRSSIGLMLVNMESFRYPEQTETEETENPIPEFNRNIGLEYNLASSNNLWNGKAFMLKSFSPSGEGNGITQAAHIEYKSRKWNWRVQEEWVSDDYTAEVGFVPRNGYVKFNGFIGHLFFPKSSSVLSHGPTLNTNHYFNENLERSDNTTYLVYSLAFRNRSSLDVFVSDDYVRLLSPFDPTRLGMQELASDTEHRWNAFGWMFASKPQSVFTYTLDGRFGGYYEGGNRTSLTTELGYRFQPYVSLSANLNYNRIKLPFPWNTNQFWLIGSEVDITFTNKLFFATLFQYNEQSKNFNLNSRFQWRYKPASDLFIVYTNNHRLTPFTGRSWSLTLKLNYWFNP